MPRRTRRGGPPEPRRKRKLMPSVGPKLACPTDKIGFCTQAGATAAALRMSMKYGVPFRAYNDCHRCPNWHVTRQREKPRGRTALAPPVPPAPPPADPHGGNADPP